MINIDFNKNLLEQQINKLPENCILRMSRETLIYKVLDGLKFDEFFGRRIETFDGCGDLTHLAIYPYVRTDFDKINIEVITQ